MSSQSLPTSCAAEDASAFDPSRVAVLCHGDELYGVGTIMKLQAEHIPGLQFVCMGPGVLHDWLREHGANVEVFEGLRSFTAKGSLATLARLGPVMRRARHDAARLDELLRPRGIKIIHCHWLPQQLIAGFMRKMGYKVIWHINNNSNPRRLFGLGIKLNHRLAQWGADAIWPASDFIAANWQGSGVPTYTLRNAAVVIYDAPNTLPPTPIRCLIAGRLTQSKGHHLAVEAVIAARKTGLDVTLDIFGGPLEHNPYGEGLKQKIQQAGMEDAIRFMGFAKDLRQHHQEYHLGLQCRIDPEPCSLWVCETLVDGLPLIASDSGGTPELVQNGVTGLLFRAGDSRDLTEKLIQLARDPARLAAMRPATFQRGREHFSADRFARQSLEFYAAVAEVRP